MFAGRKRWRRNCSSAFFVAALWTLSSIACAEITPPFPAELMIEPASDTVVGGAAQQGLVLRPNVDLVRRAILQPADVQSAQVSLTVAGVDLAQSIVAKGKGENGQQIDFNDVSALQKITINSGGNLVFAVWRHQWHFSGGGELGGLTVTRLGDHVSVTVPAFSGKSSVVTALGTFSLVGVQGPKSLPKIGKRVDAVADKAADTWSVPDSKGAKIKVTQSAIQFLTVGRADFSDVYEWIPAIVFTPSESGEYQIAGQLKINSGRASDKEDKLTVTWAWVLDQAGPQPAARSLKFYRLLKPWAHDATVPAGSLIAGQDYDSVPLAELPLEKAKVGTKQNLNADMQSAFVHWLAGEWANDGLMLTVDPPQAAVKLQRDLKGTLSVTSYPKNQLFHHAIQPRPGVYTLVKDGKLSYGGERLRLWGVAGSAGAEMAADRLARMGFNAIRMWGVGGQGFKGNPCYDETSAKTGEFRAADSYKTGESNPLDIYDRYFAACKKQGMFIMCPQLMSYIGWAYLAQDGSFVSGGNDWNDWKTSLLAKTAKGNRIWIAFDERLIAAQKKHYDNFLNHVNPYTGRKYAEEECVAIWEIHNEHSLMRVALEADVSTWPAYFRNKLQVRWNEWLKNRYGNSDAIKVAWGELAANEKVESGSVMPGPFLAERTRYPEKRGNDFVAFFTDMISRYYKEMERYARAQGAPGVGVAVIPFSYDTQYQPNTPWHFSTAGQADVATFGMYYWFLKSSLLMPPAAYVMDSHTIAGKPTVIYETNSCRPNPYRAEQPFINAALASWQDWDAMFFHYYHSRAWPDEQFCVAELQYMTEKFYWSAVEFERDPSMLAATGLAGEAFLKGYIKPAPKPVTYRLGKKAIEGFAHWNGVSMSRATFQRGAAIRYEPKEDFDLAVDGASEGELSARIESAIAAGDELTWDWPNGRMIIDSPCYKAYIGRPPENGGWYRFKDGLAVGKFQNDFVALAISSQDGRPLVGSEASRLMHINARRDSRNTGFSMDVSQFESGFVNPVEQAKKIRSVGRAPTVEDQVPFTVCFPTQITGRWQSYDLTTREIISTTKISNGTIEYDGTPIFMGVLSIEKRGNAIDTPHTTIATSSAQNASAEGSEKSDPQLAGVWHPLALLNWSQNYQRAHRALRESSLTYASITPVDHSEKADKRIRITDLNVMLNAPASFDIDFVQNRMKRVTATFSQPPAIADVINVYEEKFGKPEEKVIVQNAFEVSKVAWKAESGKKTLSIVMTQTQGIMNIVYELLP